jgi:hypothetical protein
MREPDHLRLVRRGQASSAENCRISCTFVSPASFNGACKLLRPPAPQAEVPHRSRSRHGPVCMNCSLHHAWRRFREELMLANMAGSPNARTARLICGDDPHRRWPLPAPPPAQLLTASSRSAITAPASPALMRHDRKDTESTPPGRRAGTNRATVRAKQVHVDHKETVCHRVSLWEGRLQPSQLFAGVSGHGIRSTLAQGASLHDSPATCTFPPSGRLNCRISCAVGAWYIISRSDDLWPATLDLSGQDAT